MSVDVDMDGWPADIIVCELIDSGLLKEHMLPTLHHAVGHLAAPHAIVIPARARIYAQLVESQLLRSWHRLEDGGRRATVLSRHPLLGGDEAADDREVEVQATSLLPHVRPLHEPVVALSFDFTTGADAIPLEGEQHHDIMVTRAGTPHALLWWWTVELCDNTSSGAGDCSESGDPVATTITTEPGSQLREHWMQYIKLLGGVRLPCGEGACVSLVASHDRSSAYFNVGNATGNCLQPAADEASDKFSPVAGDVQTLWTYRRKWALNDMDREALYIKALHLALVGLTETSFVVVASEGGYLALLAAWALPLSLLARRRKAVLAPEPVPASQKLVEELAEEVGLASIVKVLNKHPHEITSSDLGSDHTTVGAVVAEPFFYSETMPWHGLACWLVTAALRQNGLLAPDAAVMPRRALLMGMMVSFVDGLQETQPVGNASGFDHSAYDDLIRSRRGQLHSLTLWEYPHIAMSARHKLLELDLTLDPYDVAAKVDLPLLPESAAALPNALVCWMDYELDRDAQLVAHGMPANTAEPSYHRVAVQYVYEDELASGAKAVTVQATFTAADFDVKLAVDSEGSHRQPRSRLNVLV
eukprot:gnl/TRDRNA2_/TRDRNA2_125442_c0_seq1.p1 gnl/TRDRNA2_/TRDRNA2_125442_c0~~gnl/TRDRNA2_/TRDRNA2_125442_c0_seq1.p1  ORF type:complete len:630 (+),score=103.62 gnl/TRDRNA2_/TRDRNA2_125442_c0_seq1:127-1890(+)